MTRRRPAQGRSLAVFLILACLLGAGLLVLIREQPDLLVRRLAVASETLPPALTPTNVPVAGQPTAPLPESLFAVIALRPLFTSSRRPAEQAAAPKSISVPKELPAVILTGIIRSGADSLAIVEPAKPGAQADPPLSLHVGDSMGGWTVEAIGLDRIVLIQGDERRELVMKMDETRRRQFKLRNDRKINKAQQHSQPPRTVQPTQPPRVVQPTQPPRVVQPTQPPRTE